MVIGCCQIEIHLPGSGSLKEKRRVIVSLRDRLRRRHNVSFAEVEHQELWQRAGLVVVSVAGDRRQLDRLFEIIRGELTRTVPGEVVQFAVEYI